MDATARLKGWPELPPASLYIHVPFCRHRCGYCNFTLVAGRDQLVERYIDALFREIDLWREAPDAIAVPPLRTLYLGGGTPSHLTVPQLRRLATGILDRFPLDPSAEFTLEANPADMTSGLARCWEELGVNRVSLGVQSFRPAKLQLLERDHDAGVIANAFSLCRSFARSVSIDLIAAVPGETPEEWARDLQAAFALAPDHLSIYELTWERGTTFWGRLLRGRLADPDEQTKLEILQQTLGACEAAGFNRYEISSFARDAGHRSRHNRAYWTGEPWLAFGPGAASFLHGVRQTRHRGVLAWMRKVETGQTAWEADILPPLQRAAEILCVGLRQVEGVNEADFRRCTGFPVHAIAPATLDWLRREGLLADGPQGIRLAARGLLLHDHVAGQILAGAG